MSLSLCRGDGEACGADVPEGAPNHVCSEPGTPEGLCWQRPPPFLGGLASSALAVLDTVAIEMRSQAPLRVLSHGAWPALSMV